jgi:hypothetical protein
MLETPETEQESNDLAEIYSRSKRSVNASWGRHAGENRHPEFFENPGFQTA